MRNILGKFGLVYTSEEKAALDDYYRITRIPLDKRSAEDLKILGKAAEFPHVMEIYKREIAQNKARSEAKFLDEEYERTKKLTSYNSDFSDKLSVNAPLWARLVYAGAKIWDVYSRRSYSKSAPKPVNLSANSALAPQISPEIVYEITQTLGPAASNIIAQIPEFDAANPGNIAPEIFVIAALITSKSPTISFLTAVGVLQLLPQTLAEVFAPKISKAKQLEFVKSLQKGSAKADYNLFEEKVISSLPIEIDEADKELIKRSLKLIPKRNRPIVSMCMELMEQKGNGGIVIEELSGSAIGAFKVDLSANWEILRNKIFLSLSRIREGKGFSKISAEEHLADALSHEATHCTHELSQTIIPPAISCEAITCSLNTKARLLDDFRTPNGLKWEKEYNEFIGEINDKITLASKYLEKPEGPESEYFANIGVQFLKHHKGRYNMMFLGSDTQEYFDEMAVIFKKNNNQIDYNVAVHVGAIFMNHFIAPRRIESYHPRFKITEIMAHLDQFHPSLREAINPEMNELVKDMRDTIVEKGYDVLDEEHRRSLDDTFSSQKEIPNSEIKQPKAKPSAPKQKAEHEL